jgi:hypothetical protein
VDAANVGSGLEIQSLVNDRLPTAPLQALLVFRPETVRFLD